MRVPPAVSFDLGTPLFICKKNNLTFICLFVMLLLLVKRKEWLMLMERELTLDERVKELKERFTKLGIAEYRTSTCEDEYESLVSYLREKESFRYAFVREPYSRSKNMIFRLMKVDIWKPSLPMGYVYSPGFTFDYIGENPLGEAIRMANILMGQKYSARKIKDEMGSDRASFKKLTDEYKRMSDEDLEYLKSRNYAALKWK